MTTMRKSTNGLYQIALTPVKVDLHNDLYPRASADSSPHSPESMVRPPTPGGGPLSSHPATPPTLSRHVTPTSSIRHSATPPSRKLNPTLHSPPPSSTRKLNSERIPLSPTSPNSQSMPQSKPRDSAGVRKLLSLSSLRNSFASSRTSLSLHNSPSQQPPATVSPTQNPRRRPSTTSSTFYPASYNPTYQTYTANVVADASHKPRSMNSPPQLKKRKSGTWYKRKSGFFTLETGELEENNHRLDSVAESQSRPDTAAQRPVAAAPPPTLPDVGALKGGTLTGGSFAGEDIFADIGR